MIKKLLKIENLIILLVAVSAIAIAVYQWIPREYSIRPGDSWKTLAVADKYEGGNSNAIDESNDSEFAYRYNIHEGNKNPFALLFFHPAEEDKLFDWRWMETISITAYIEGKERENYRLQLRNREEELFSPDENISRKYNQASLQLTNRPTTQTVSLDQFSVPGWWLEQVKMTPENVTPCFDNIEWVEFNTANVPITSPELEEMPPPAPRSSVMFAVMLLLLSLTSAESVKMPPPFPKRPVRLSLTELSFNVARSPLA